MTFFQKVLLIYICTVHSFFLTINASDLDSPFLFARTIDGEIACEEVAQSVGIAKLEDGSISHSKSYFCDVDPAYTTGSAKGIRLLLENIESDFELEWKKSVEAGKTRLVVSDGTISGSSLRLPDSPKQMKQTTALTTFQHDEFGANWTTNQCYTPLLNWQVPHSSEKGQPSRRKLAVNQIGAKTAVVFRIKTNNGFPTPDAAAISNAVFGTSGDAVTLSSMYDACSYNQFTIVATDIAGQTYAAAGVVDINLESSTTAASYATDIKNLVILQVGSAYLDSVDHVLLAMVS
jgi:hypothetical protein